MIKTIFLIGIVVVKQGFSFAEDITACESTKEFITTNEFLKSEKQYFRNADLSFATSKKVAEGCTGAAKRFIKTVKTLSKTDLNADEIILAAELAALKTDGIANAFIKIFSRLYASDDFDFNLATSLKLARSLSVDFKGDAEVALKDFEAVTKFCLKNPLLNLDKMKCATLSQEIALLSEKSLSSVSSTFEKSYNYMLSSEGPHLIPQEALKLSKELISIHPEAYFNFKDAYEYGLSNKGLGLSSADAIKFAKSMAGKTLPANKSN